MIISARITCLSGSNWWIAGDRCRAASPASDSSLSPSPPTPSATSQSNSTPRSFRSLCPPWSWSSSGKISTPKTISSWGWRLNSDSNSWRRICSILIMAITPTIPQCSAHLLSWLRSGGSGTSRGGIPSTFPPRFGTTLAFSPSRSCPVSNVSFSPNPYINPSLTSNLGWTHAAFPASASPTR